ncbi:MAG: O-methyltransferase [Paludibacter sp.]|nr:O-methyltransferase [Paludibacter sp.]
MNEDEYILAHSDAEPEYLALINRKTHLKMINPRMMSGHLQGRALAMFCSMMKPERILEIGTFTGYSALCMAETLNNNGIIHTIERDDELEDFILENFALSGLAHKIRLHIGDAIQIIKKLGEIFDLVFIDGDKREYADYYEAVFPKVRNGGFILADNTLWDGKVLKRVDANDVQTIEIMRFNDMIARDNRVEKVILPLRDGLTIIRKKNP